MSLNVNILLYQQVWGVKGEFETPRGESVAELTMYTDIRCRQREVPVQYVEDLSVADPFRPYFPYLRLN